MSLKIIKTTFKQFMKKKIERNKCLVRSLYYVWYQILLIYTEFNLRAPPGKFGRRDFLPNFPGGGRASARRLHSLTLISFSFDFLVLGLILVWFS